MVLKSGLAKQDRKAESTKSDSAEANSRSIEVRPQKLNPDTASRRVRRL